MASKLLKADEVASILDVSKSFVYQLIRTGQLRAVRIGTAVRVRPEDLDAFVAKNLEARRDDWLSSQPGDFRH
jgi:excisionase family DNA binding protein